MDSERDPSFRPGDTIIRVDHSRENPFLQLSRKTVRDRGLTWEELGFLAFLLDKPSNWRVRPEEIAKERGISRATVYNLLNKLIAKGYVHREVIRRKANGRFESGSITIVFEDKEYRREWADRQRFQTSGEIEDARFRTTLDGQEVPF